MKARDFQRDFLALALYDGEIYGAERRRQRVALALDIAILYGALEARTGNESLTWPLETLEAAYWEKVARLKAMS